MRAVIDRFEDQRRRVADPLFLRCRTSRDHGLRGKSPQGGARRCTCTTSSAAPRTTAPSASLHQNGAPAGWFVMDAKDRVVDSLGLAPMSSGLCHDKPTRASIRRRIQLQDP